jgi:lysozyme
MLCGYEGYVGRVYMDQAGIPTIGYGHALTHDEIVAGTYHGRTLTQPEAMELCKKDISRFEDAVNKLVSVPLSQAQFDALVDFSFNLGAGALASSTLLVKLNAGNYIGAASEFVKWDHIGKREDMGLKGRREGEARLFLEGMPSVGGPTLDDVLRLAEAQQVDLSQSIDWMGRRETPTEPAPAPVSERVTLPDVAVLPKDPEEA